jgi:hypothetical protein
LPEALDHRLIGGHHVAVQIRQRYLRPRARRQAEQVERRVGPAHGTGDEVLLPAAETAEALRVIEELGQPDPGTRRAVAVPGEDHAVEEPGHPQVGQRSLFGFGLDNSEPAGQGLTERTGDMLTGAPSASTRIARANRPEPATLAG